MQRENAPIVLAVRVWCDASRLAEGVSLSSKPEEVSPNGTRQAGGYASGFMARTAVVAVTYQRVEVRRTTSLEGRALAARAA